MNLRRSPDGSYFRVLKMESRDDSPPIYFANLMHLMCLAMLNGLEISTKGNCVKFPLPKISTVFLRGEEINGKVILFDANDVEVEITWSELSPEDFAEFISGQIFSKIFKI